MGNPTQVPPLGLSLSRAADIRLSVGHLSCLSPQAGHRPSTLRVQPWVVRGEAEMAEVCGRLFVQEAGSVHRPTVPTIHMGGGPGRCTATGRTCRAAPYPASGSSPVDQVQQPLPGAWASECARTERAGRRRRRAGRWRPLGRRSAPVRARSPSSAALALPGLAPSAGPGHCKIPPRLRLMDTFRTAVGGMAVGFRRAAARDLAAG